MLPLNLPSYPIKMQQRGGKNVIFDSLRKKFVALTPEEWVRQHFVHYLTDVKGYPTGWTVSSSSPPCDAGLAAGFFGAFAGAAKALRNPQHRSNTKISFFITDKCSFIVENYVFCSCLCVLLF